MLDLLLFAIVGFAAGSIFSDGYGEKKRRPIDVTPTRTTTDDHFKVIKDNNREILEFKKKLKKDGRLQPYDSGKIITLGNERDRLFNEYKNNKEVEIIENIKTKPNNFEDFIISKDKLHLIQYHVGQTVLGKVCNKCNRPMILQFARNKEISDLSDFFWGCTGWYFEVCKSSEPFIISDFSLLTENNKNEFHITNNDLTNIFDNNMIENHTLKRVGNHVNQAVDDYVCPIHKEPLILKPKKYGAFAGWLIILGIPA